MNCPRCGQENPPGAVFCNACGARLDRACPACGHPNTPGSRFCNHCGQTLEKTVAPAGPSRFSTPASHIPRHLAEKILISRSALEGERKHVTVLFADLKGSMEVLAGRDPEEARSLLDPVLERMCEAVHRYEGTVNQVMGDGIMALFGAPVAHEDHALRACYAALRMLESLARYGDAMQRSQGIAVQIRVGLNSGEVVVGSISSDLQMDYTAVGQTTHLAARMEQMAKAGTALITASTMKLIEGYVRVKPLGPVPVKGLMEPVDVYELLGSVPSRTRVRDVSARERTRFVGRQRELDTLRQSLDRSCAGEGQVVAIIGEPGIGKSRLLSEFTRSGEIDSCRVLEGRSMSHGKAMPYLPVLDLLKRYFHIEDGDDGRAIRERITSRLFASDTTLGSALPALLSLLDVPVDDPRWHTLDPSRRRHHTLDAVKRLLIRESRIQPLVLVFENLHYIDDETQAFLDSLIESLPMARILLLVSYRPEYGHTWANRSYYTQLRLSPLTPESAAELLHGLLGTDPDLRPLMRLLIDRTGGNPFFLQETVRSLVDTGILTEESGAYRLGKPLSGVHVPATVQAVIAARIDRLPAEDKRVLQTASVIGRHVSHPLLQAVVDLPENELRRVLDRLQTGEFLYEASLFPEVEYTFAHALTQEVAYESLLQERRRALHARIVEAFEMLEPDRLDEQRDWLAHHVVRGEVWGKAIRYFRSSGEPPHSAAPSWWTGDYQHALEVEGGNLSAASEFGHSELWFRANLRLGQIHHALGEYPRAMEFLRRIIGLLKGDLLLEPLGMLGLTSVFSRVWMTLCLAEQGEFAEAAAIGDEALRIAESADDPASCVVAHAGIATRAILHGESDCAIGAAERGAALVDRDTAAAPLLFPFIMPILGAAYTLSGRVAEAVPRLEQGVERARSVNGIAHQSRRLTWLGEAYLEAGQLGSADRVADEALNLAAKHGERGNEAYALRLLGDLAMHREPPDAAQAKGRYRAALTLAEEMEMRPLRARCHLGLGRLLRVTGSRAHAAEHLAAAATLFRELGMGVWLAKAAAALRDAGEGGGEPSEPG